MPGPPRLLRKRKEGGETAGEEKASTLDCRRMSGRRAHCGRMISFDPHPQGHRCASMLSTAPSPRPVSVHSRPAPRPGPSFPPSYRPPPSPGSPPTFSSQSPTTTNNGLLCCSQAHRRAGLFIPPSPRPSQQLTVGHRCRSSGTSTLFSSAKHVNLFDTRPHQASVSGR